MNQTLLQIKKFLALYLNFDPENIFIAFIPEQLSPADRNFIIIRELNDETLMETSETYIEDDDSLVLSNNNTKTVQIDFYGDNSFANAKTTETLLNSLTGNAYLRQEGIGCIGTENIINLTGVDIDDKYLSRYSLNADFNYNFDKVINDIGSFNDVVLDIKQIK